MLSGVRAILLDLDGVLVDSRAATAEFFQRILEAHGYPVAPRRRCDALYSRPAIVALKELSGESDPGRLDDLVQAVSSEAYPVELVKTQEDTLANLRALSRHFRLGIVSSRTRAGIAEVLACHLDPELFEAVVGYEDTTQHKPDPAPLLKGMALLDVGPRVTVYVGDSDSDIVAARRAGAISVAYGPTAVEQADASIVALQELSALLIGANGMEGETHG